MAGCLFGTKLLPEPMLTNCQLPYEQLNPIEMLIFIDENVIC